MIRPKGKKKKQKVFKVRQNTVFDSDLQSLILTPLEPDVSYTDGAHQPTMQLNKVDGLV